MFPEISLELQYNFGDTDTFANKNTNFDKEETRQLETGIYKTKSKTPRHSAVCPLPDSYPLHQLSFFPVILPELFRRTAFFLLKYPIKIRQVIKATIITNLNN